MVVDIAKFYLNYVRSQGFPLDDSVVDMILHSYYENALGFIKSYSDDAEVNNLVFDRYGKRRKSRFCLPAPDPDHRPDQAGVGAHIQPLSFGLPHRGAGRFYR